MPHSLKSKVKSLCYKGELSEKERDRIIQALEQTELNPSYNGVKSELEPCVDCVSRTELLSRIDAERKHLLELKMDGAEHIIVHHARRIIEDMPSVIPKQPCEEENPNCTECRYYDHEKHHCPRFCRVIENTMAEMTSEQTEWIPCSERLPENQDCYLVTTKWKGSYSGNVYIETNMAVYREKPKEWDCVDVIAWMPLPQPYTESEDAE